MAQQFTQPHKAAERLDHGSAPGSRQRGADRFQMRFQIGVVQEVGNGLADADRALEPQAGGGQPARPVLLPRQLGQGLAIGNRAAGGHEVDQDHGPAGGHRVAQAGEQAGRIVHVVNRLEADGEVELALGALDCGVQPVHGHAVGHAPRRRQPDRDLGLLCGGRVADPVQPGDAFRERDQIAAIAATDVEHPAHPRQVDVAEGKRPQPRLRRRHQREMGGAGAGVADGGDP